MRTPRIERLRDHALHVRFSRENNWEPRLLRWEAMRDSVGEPWHIMRKGRMIRRVLGNLTPVIDDDELIVGKMWLRPATPEQVRRLEQIEPFAAAQEQVQGQNGHAQLDVGLVLKRGTRGLQEDIRRRAATLKPFNHDDQCKLEFYEACLEALEGLCEWAGAYAAEAERQATACGDPQRKAELEGIAEVCRRVPAYPARTFHEALQSVHFLHTGTMVGEPVGLLVPGRIDRYLLPYYQADIAAGRLTPDQAQELLDCSWVIISEYVEKGLAISVIVGGLDAEGRDVTNEITWMALRAVEDVSLSYPSVGIAWHPGAPPELMERAVELMAKGTSNPALFNDPVISAGMRHYGVPAAECHEFINSTCVEITPVGGSNVWVASPYFNLSAELLGLISEVVAGEVSAPSFDALLAAYKERMGRVIAAAVADQNTARETRARNGGKPLQSCFTRDCIERGVDIDEGGARYNWVECSFVGVANLVDSLNNLRCLVYESCEMTLADLKRALDADFAGAEELAARCRDAFSRYGCDDAWADSLAQDIVAFLGAECTKHEVRLGGPFVPGFFCWIMHEYLGRVTGATPDGRRAGFPFADGAGPSQGSEREGPTAAIRSTTSWDHTPMLGGLVLNLKFAPDALADPAGRGKVLALLQTAMELGAFEVQLNCVDRAILLAAQKTPEMYRDLLVRIAGYSDYFVSLSPQMQAEILLRTEFR